MAIDSGKKKKAKAKIQISEVVPVLEAFRDSGMSESLPAG
jgi:hypothetical protein